MRYLIALLLCLSGALGWADIGGSTKTISIEYIELYDISIGTVVWRVSKGTESFTLDEFVSSGKFCKWRGGHKWKWVGAIFTDPFADISGQKCKICGRCRQKVLKNKEVWELED